MVKTFWKNYFDTHQRQSSSTNLIQASSGITNIQDSSVQYKYFSQIKPLKETFAVLVLSLDLFACSVRKIILIQPTKTLRRPVFFLSIYMYLKLPWRRCCLHDFVVPRNTCSIFFSLKTQPCGKLSQNGTPFNSFKSSTVSTAAHKSN